MTERRGAIPEWVRRAIFGLSRGRCYEPDCREPMVVVDGGVPAFVGEVAHIVGAVTSGPRGTEEIDDREGFGNLLLLCGKHHKIIDDPRTRDRHPSEVLREWKRKRESGIDTTALSELSHIRDLAVRLPDMLVEAFGAIPESTIQVGEGVAGIEAAFNEAYRAAGGPATLGPPAGLCFEEGPGSVQHFKGAGLSDGPVICALPGRRAVVVDSSVWAAVSQLGDPVRGGGVVGAGFPSATTTDASGHVRGDAAYVDLEWSLGTGPPGANADRRLALASQGQDRSVCID